MKFTHLARKKVGAFVEPKWQVDYKPEHAFYVACSDSWEKWLREEEVYSILGKYKYRYTYDIPKDKLLCINSPQAINIFKKKYATPAPVEFLPIHMYEVVYGPYKPSSMDKLIAPHGYALVRDVLIDWNAVHQNNKHKYVGVLIDPNASPTYEPWICMFDVCSAVLWSMDHVKLVNMDRVSLRKTKTKSH
jgi:hypothetical protein